MQHTGDSSSSGTVRWRTYAWGVLALVTCPCRLPVWILLLSDTVAGTLLAKHQSLAFGLLSL